MNQNVETPAFKYLNLKNMLPKINAGKINNVDLSYTIINDYTARPLRRNMGKCFYSVQIGALLPLSDGKLAIGFKGGNSEIHIDLRSFEQFFEENTWNKPLSLVGTNTYNVCSLSERGGKLVGGFK